MPFKIVLFLCLSVTVLTAQDASQLIQPVHITAGETDSILISDIFYAADYDITFLPADNLSAVYEPGKNTVVITASDNFKGIVLLPFKLKEKEYVIPVIAEEKYKRSFYYKPGNKPGHVNLFGSFNGWNREAEPMTDENNDGIYETTILIEPGRYEYKFFVDGREVVDPANPEKVPNGMGDYNSILTVKSPGAGKLSLHKKALSHGSGNAAFTFSVLPENYILSEKEIIALLDNQVIPSENISVVKNSFTVTLSNDALNEYHTIRTAVNGRDANTALQQVFLKDGYPVPANDSKLSQGKIIYSLMIDRFSDGDKSNSIPVASDSVSPKANYMGGDLQGVINKLNEKYFDSLGINTIWLSPVVQNTDSAFMESPEPHRWFTAYHGYWPSHPTNVEERFGTMQQVKDLVSLSHSKNIKILLDYVAHHVHIDHPYWKTHRDWFGKLDLPDGRKNLRLWDEQRLTTWFEPYMPSFDYVSSTAALDTMTDNAVWWLKETGIDGFRHDAVKHVPNEFWRLLTKKIIEHIDNKDIYQIGETFGGYDLISSYVNNGQLNAQFNFNLYDTAIPVFIEHSVPFSALDDQMQKTFAVYGVNHVMGNIMDSHDKVRFMAYADGDVSMSSGNPTETGWNNPPVVDNRRSYDRLKLYMAYMLTIPGVPVIYYGDEFGMTGASDPDNRRMMRFGGELSVWEQQTLIDVRKIVNIRNSHTALKYGDFFTLKADTNNYAYIRSDFNERILTVLNKGTRGEKYQLDIPAVYNAVQAVDLITGEKFLINKNVLYLNMPSGSFRIFRVK